MNYNNVLHQDTSLTTIKNICSQKKTPHSFLFYGQEGIGKFSSALFFSQLILCKEFNSKNLPCNNCSSCIEIFKYKNPNLLILSNDDRISYIKFYIQKIKEQKKHLVPFLYNEIYLLIYRYQSGFLSILEKPKKKAFPEGFPLKNKKEQQKMDDNITEIKKKLKQCIDKKDFFLLTEEIFLENLIQLQNCLDRSILKKENIDKLFSHLKIYQKEKRIIIINDINKMDSSVIGKFLKILEEPPENTIFLLLSKNWQSMDAKITLPLFSRCMRLKFNSLNKNQINNILTKKYRINNAEESIENNLKTTFYNLSSQKSDQKIISDIFNKKVNGKKISIEDAIKYLNTHSITSKKFIEEAKKLLKKKVKLAGEQFYFKFKILQKMINESEQSLISGRMKEENILIEFLIRFYKFY